MQLRSGCEAAVLAAGLPRRLCKGRQPAAQGDHQACPLSPPHTRLVITLRSPLSPMCSRKTQGMPGCLQSTNHSITQSITQSIKYV